MDWKKEPKGNRQALNPLAVLPPIRSDDVATKTDSFYTNTRAEASARAQQRLTPRITAQAPKPATPPHQTAPAKTNSHTSAKPQGAQAQQSLARQDKEVLARPHTAPVKSTVQESISMLNERDQRALEAENTPVAIAIESFKSKRAIEMVENGFNYDEESNPGYIATFSGANPFDAAQSVLGLEYLFDKEGPDTFGKILASANNGLYNISGWKPNYTLGDLSKLDPKNLAAIAMMGDMAPPKNRSAIDSKTSSLRLQPATKDGPSADFGQYVIYALQRISITPQYQALSPKLRENYLQHSAKLIVLQLYEITQHPLTKNSFTTLGTPLGKDNIARVLDPVRAKYADSLTQDTNRKHAIRVWNAQKKVVDEQSKETSAPLSRPTSAVKTPAQRPAAPKAPKEAPKMVFALQFPAPVPFKACADTVLTRQGKELLETAVLAPWQFTSITSFDRNLAKLRKAKTDGTPAKVATIKLDGATGEGKTHTINLLRDAYKDSINIISIDLNSSDLAIKQIEEAKKSDPDRINVVIVDELYFYNAKFLKAATGKEDAQEDAQDNATIEKAKAKYIKDLQDKGILVCVSGATENPLIYRLAAERIKDKMAEAYKQRTKEEDRLFAAEVLKLPQGTVDEQIDDIEIQETTKLTELKEYIAAQENKLKQKLLTAGRMEKKRATIRNKISSDDCTYVKSEDLDSYHEISADKLKPNKSTLYILPDISAKKFSAADCRTVAGNQDCIIITPFFYNEGKPNQSLKYKIWTKKGGSFTGLEVVDGDIGKAVTALNSALPRIIVYDDTTAVGGDLGGLALGVEDVVLQYKSKGKSWDVAVQNDGRNRTPKEKDASGNEIITAKYHIISDKESKEDLVTSIDATQERQDQERMDAHIDKKDKKEATKDYLAKAQGQSTHFENKLSQAKDDYDLGAAGRYRKKIEAEKLAEEKKRQAKALELERQRQEEEDRVRREEEERRRLAEVERTRKEEEERRQQEAKERAVREAAETLRTTRRRLMDAVSGLDTPIANIAGSLSELSAANANLGELGAFFTQLDSSEEQEDLSLKNDATIAAKANLEALLQEIQQVTQKNELQPLKEQLERLRTTIEGATETNSLPKNAEISELERKVRALETSSKNLAARVESITQETSALKNAKESEREALLAQMSAKEAEESRRLQQQQLQEALRLSQEALLTARRSEARELFSRVTELKRELETDFISLDAVGKLDTATHELSQKEGELKHLQKENGVAQLPVAADVKDKRLEELRQKNAEFFEKLEKAIGNDLTLAAISTANIDGIASIIEKAQTSSIDLNALKSSIKALKRDAAVVLKGIEAESAHLDSEIAHQKSLIRTKIAREADEQKRKQELDQKEKARVESQQAGDRAIENKRAKLLQDIDIATQMLSAETVNESLAALNQSLQEAGKFKASLTTNIAALAVLSAAAETGKIVNPTTASLLERRVLLDKLIEVEEQSKLGKEKEDLLRQLATERTRIAEAASSLISSAEEQANPTIAAASFLRKIASATTDASAIISDKDGQLAEFNKQNKDFERDIAQRKQIAAQQAQGQDAESKRQQKIRDEATKLADDRAAAELLLSSTKALAKEAGLSLGEVNLKINNIDLQKELQTQKARLADIIAQAQGVDEKAVEGLRGTADADDEVEVGELSEKASRLQARLAQTNRSLAEIDLEAAKDSLSVQAKSGIISAHGASITKAQSEITSLDEEIDAIRERLASSIITTTEDIVTAGEELERRLKQAGDSKGRARRAELEAERLRKQAEDDLIRAKNETKSLLSKTKELAESHLATLATLPDVLRALKIESEELDQGDEAAVKDEAASKKADAIQALLQRRDGLLAHSGLLTTQVSEIKKLLEEITNDQISDAKTIALVNEIRAKITEHNEGLVTLGKSIVALQQQIQALRTNVNLSNDAEARAAEEARARARAEEEARAAAAKAEQNSFAAKKALLQATYDKTVLQLKDLSPQFAEMIALRTKLEDQIAKERAADITKGDVSEEDESVPDERTKAIKKITKLEQAQNQIKIDLKVVEDYLRDLGSADAASINIKEALKQIDIHQASLINIQAAIKQLKENIIVAIEGAKQAEIDSRLGEEDPVPVVPTATPKDPPNRVPTATLRKLNLELEAALKHSVELDNPRLDADEERLEAKYGPGYKQALLKTYKDAKTGLNEEDKHLTSWVTGKTKGNLQENRERKILGRENALFTSFYKACEKIAGALDNGADSSSLLTEVWDKSDLQKDGNKFALTNTQKIALVRVLMLQKSNDEFWTKRNIGSDEAKQAFLNTHVNGSTVKSGMRDPDSELDKMVQASLGAIKTIGSEGLQRLVKIRTEDAIQKSEGKPTEKLSGMRPASAIKMRGDSATRLSAIDKGITVY